MKRDLALENDVAVATLELDRAAFVDGFPRWFLIIPVEQAAKPSVRFRTVASEDLKRLIAAADEDHGVSTSFKSPRWNRQPWRAEPLKKRIASPFADRISIGRASNVDVVIRSRVVSKLHAHVVLDGERAPTVTDLDSHNGTFINSSRLAPHEAGVISNGDVVSFGQLHCEFARSDVVYFAVRRRSLRLLEAESNALQETRRIGNP
jgi:FHA domain-containing protein